MADIIDDANDRAEVFLRASQTWRKGEGPEPTGACLNCEAPVAAPLRWCDVDCRDEWQALHPDGTATPESQRRTIFALPAPPAEYAGCAPAEHLPAPDSADHDTIQD